MDLQVVGTIVEVGDEITKGSFVKRDLIVKTDGQYPQTYCVEFPKEKGELLDFRKAGDRVTCHVNLRGRSWDNNQGETKYFLSLQCWKIEV